MRISLGGYSQATILDITNNTKFSDKLIKWHNLTEPVWSLKYVGLYLQDDKIEEKPMTAFIDLNFTNIRVPIAHFKIIMDYIMVTKDCKKVNDKANSLFTCVCKNFYDCGFPKLKIHLKTPGSPSIGFNLTLNSSQYIRYDFGTLRCIVLLEPDHFGIDGGAWRLGQIFLNSYYTIFDAERLRIGLV